MSANKTIDDFGEDDRGAEEGGTVLGSHHAHTDDMPFQSDERNYERLTQNNQIVNAGGTVSNQSPKFDGTATRLDTIEQHNDLAGPVENDTTHANELNAPRANVEFTERSTIAADAVAAAKDWYDDEPTQRIGTDNNNRLDGDDSSYPSYDNATAMSPPHGRKLQRCDSTAKHSTIIDRRSNCDNTNRLIMRSTNHHNGSAECRYSEHSSSNHRRNVPVRLNDHMSRKRNDDSGDGDSKDCRIELPTDRNSHPKQHTDQHRYPQQHVDRHPHPQQHADQHSHTQQHVDQHPHPKQYTNQQSHTKQHADGHTHPQQHVDRHPHPQQHVDRHPHPQQHIDRHPHSQQHADEHPHPQKHADVQPQPHQRTDGQSHPDQHVDGHPHPKQHTDGHPHPKQHTDGHAHPKQHADGHLHSQQHTDGHTHPHQHTDGHLYPKQHADEHMRPQQHTDRHSNPQQHTDGHTQPRQHADRHPHSKQHADGHTHPQQHADGHSHLQQHAHEHGHPKQHADRHSHPQQYADRLSHQQQHVDHNPHLQYATHSHKTVATPHLNVAGHSHHHEVANAQSNRHGTANDQHHETGGKRLLQRSKSTLHVRTRDEDADASRRYSIHGGVLTHEKHETKIGAESHHGRHNPKPSKSAESGGYNHNHQRQYHGESAQRSAGNDKKQHSTYRRRPLESVDETIESKESNYVGGCLFSDAYYKKQPEKHDTERYNDSKKVNFSSKPNFEYYHDYVPGTVHSPRDEDCTVFAETPPNSDDCKNNGHAPNDHHGYSTTGTAAAQASYYSQLDRSYGDDKNTDSDESLTDSLEEGCKYEGAAVSYFLSLNGQKSAVTFTLKMPNTLESRLNRRHSQLKKHLHVTTTVRKTSVRVRTRHKSCQTLWTEEKGVQVQRGSTANANRKYADDHKVLETLLAGMTRHHVSENQIRVVGGRKLVSEGNQTERMPEPPTDRQTQTTRDAAAGPETPDNSTTGGRNNRGQSMKKFSSDNALMVGMIRQNKYKGKEAVDGAKNDQLLTLSKGWINFYTLRADSADCTDAQESHDNDDEIKTEDDSQHYTVHVQAIPEPVTLPVVQVPNRNNLQLTKTCSTVKHLPKLVQTENNNHHCAPSLATATTNGWCVSVDGPNNMHMKVSLMPDKLDNKTSEHFDHNDENKLESRRLALQRKNNYMRKPYRSIKRTQSTPRDMFSADVSRTESALSAESKYIETIDTQLLIHKARRRLSQEWDTRIQNGGVTESVQLVVTGDSVSSKTSQHYANRGQHCSFRRQSRRI